jgi:diacylglycerol kinase family enzyme
MVSAPGWRNVPVTLVSGKSVPVPAPTPSADASALLVPRRRRAAVIVNPHATTTSPQLRSLVIHALSHRFDLEPVDTEAPQHASTLARDAVASGVDVVITLGGDGTVNEAANGLAGTGVPLIPLPGGATNVYHRLIGIPKNIIDATEHVLRLADDWRPRTVDLGRIGDRFFTFAAGVGLDASVVDQVDSRPLLKARLGPWYYATAAFGTFMSRYMVNGPRFVLEVDGGPTIEGATAIFQNAEAFTFFMARPIRLINDGGLHTGAISGAILRHTRPTIMPGIARRAISGTHDLPGHRAVDRTGPLVTGRIRSADDRPLPVQVDGDFIGEHTELELGVLPDGLTVVS